MMVSGSKGMDVGPSPRAENGMGSRVVFEDETSKFSRDGGDPLGNIGSSVQKPRFMIDHDKLLPVDCGLDRGDQFFRGQGGAQRGCDLPREVEQGQPWNAGGSVSSPSGDGSGGDEEDDEDEEGDIDEGDGEVDGLVSADNAMAKNHNNSSGSVQSSSEKICREKLDSHEHHSLMGLIGGGLLKDRSSGGRGSTSEQQYRPCRADQYNRAINIAEPEICYALLQREDLSALAQKDAGGENDCLLSGRKQISASNDSGESLRLHLSDPITGILMDDAIILSCGHSYGSAGMQHVIRMKACFKCGCPASGDTMRPNLALRAAVQAFRREEESQSSKSSKRRRERFEQEMFNCDDSLQADTSRGKGVQFPFAVSDKVIIKGNKRTPQRFVGRVAVVTTQCLNGWYVVKTLDNAESVKLQYRSLAKVADDTVPSKDLSPNWV